MCFEMPSHSIIQLPSSQQHPSLSDDLHHNWQLQFPASRENDGSRSFSALYLYMRTTIRAANSQCV